jgi:soluble lytic murein transglycosylase-like protein
VTGGRRRTSDRASAWAAGLVAALGYLLAVPAEAQYLAVFSDGRVLQVKAANLVGTEQIRLELKSGGAVQVPLTRLESVIEDVVEAAPEPLPPPPCPPQFADQPLPEATPYRSEILAASRAAGLHPWLVAAVVEAESKYDRWAVSRAGARGLMQLMPAVWTDGGIRDPHNAQANLRVGCAHLKALLKRFGDLPLALAAYNAGPVVVERHQGMPPYRETRAFVRRVLSRYCPSAA